MNKIELPLSKKKICLLIFSCLVFVVLGIWISFYLAAKQVGFYSTLLEISGLIGIVFFGAAGILNFKQLFNRKPGLVIDEEGIWDNSTALGFGLIEWNDVIEITTVNLLSTHFVLIKVDNPEKYINRASKFRARNMKRNLKVYGTPLAISSTPLSCNFRELENNIRSSYQEYMVSSIGR